MALTRAQRCLVRVLRFFSGAFLTLLSLALRVSALLSWKAKGARGSRPAWRTVPPPDQPLLLLPAGELARRIRRRELKCVDLLETYIERIKQVNPLINAIVKDRFEAALQEAQVVDQLLSDGQEDEESLQKKFPLLGIPVTVKEAFALYGVVPNDGQFPDAVGHRINFLCTGPMCRYAEDMELLLRVMAGPNISKLKLDDPVSLQKIKFYSMEHDGGSIFLLPVDKEILQAHRKTVAHLETDLGVEVENVAISKMKYSFQIWSVMMSSKSSDNQENQTFTDLLGDHGKPVWPSWELVKWMMRLSSHTFPAIALGITEKLTKYNSKANAKLASMAQSLQTEMVELLGENGVFLYPSHPVLAPKHHAPLGMPFNFAYTAIFNILGLPVTQCPLGLSKDGLPLGIQVVAGPHNDHLTLAVARYLEKAFGGWVPPGQS
ncbi:PREDICTED: fatty-acid amide hydrolase 2 [Thamnophis sirtalis]|uniref:Fatty-acid amide hydrolase 2 n=1 Tax=Thamnophis sirtalis TaxID=35019 RepID=A0A6I9Y0A7_9SAUR|nr:PREDICTED: fatty-acid amide hydrolase 2 [Thamnophis sirtalis]